MSGWWASNPFKDKEVDIHGTGEDKSSVPSPHPYSPVECKGTIRTGKAMLVCEQGAVRIPALADSAAKTLSRVDTAWGKSKAGALRAWA